MTNEELSQILEFMRTTQTLYALGLIIVSALSPIVVAVITIKWQKKSKSIEIYFEHRLKAYQTYIDNLHDLVKLTRKDINTFLTIKQDEELRNMVIQELLPSQAKALMFASPKLTKLICSCDDVIAKLLMAKDNEDYVELIKKLNKIIDDMVKIIQAELRRRA